MTCAEYLPSCDKQFGFNSSHSTDLCVHYKTARAIIGTKDPSRQKFLSKHISGFVKQRWHDKRDDLIEELINCKFSQNPHLAEKLCATGTLQLEKAISYDNYWGTELSIVSKNTTIFFLSFFSLD